jgi:hypothetical protein
MRLPKIVKCRCGKKGRIVEPCMVGSYVTCQNEKCWWGPLRDTKREAIEAWNEVMEQKENES